MDDVLIKIVLAVVLLAIPLLQRLANARQTHGYDVLVPSHELKQEELLALMGTNQLQVLEKTLSKSAAGINYVWQAYGKPDDHQAAMLALMEQDEIEAFQVV